MTICGLFRQRLRSRSGNGWEEMDKICTYERGRSVYVTGVPGAGKSEWVDELVLRLCLRHQWKIGFFSPENIPIVYHLRKLIEKLTGHRFQNGCGMTEGLLANSEDFLTENVSHISLKGNVSPDPCLPRLMKSLSAVAAASIVFDPLNRFDHNPQPGQTETQYISNLLNKFTEFAVQHNCLLVVVVHPRKMNRNPVTGITPRVEMYDINGSADFYNKADYGIIGGTRQGGWCHTRIRGQGEIQASWCRWNGILCLRSRKRTIPALVKNLTTLLSPLTSVSEIQCSTTPAGYLKKSCFKVLGIKYQVLSIMMLSIVAMRLPYLIPNT